MIINADTRESELLLNQRMAYVAVSRTREEARIYTNSQEDLGAALDRRVDKEMGLEAFSQSQTVKSQEQELATGQFAILELGRQNSNRIDQGMQW